MPAGYCRPKGRLQKTAGTLAAADTANVTLATLFRCDSVEKDDSPGVDYYVIKTPTGAMSMQVSRPDFLASLAPAYGKATWVIGPEADKVDADVGRALSSAVGQKVLVDGAFATRGTDDNCAYLGGTTRVTMSDVAYETIIGTCITSSGQKPLVVFRYDDPTREDGIVGAMQDARALAISFVRLAP